MIEKDSETGNFKLTVATIKVGDKGNPPSPRFDNVLAKNLYSRLENEFNKPNSKVERYPTNNRDYLYLGGNLACTTRDNEDFYCFLNISKTGISKFEFPQQ